MSSETKNVVLDSARLRLRRFADSDLEAFAALNGDPEVTEHLLGPLTRAASDAMANRINALIDEHGYSFFCVEWRDTGACIGFCGVTPVKFALPRASGPLEEERREIEIGWRLARPFWGRGIATEAARRTLSFAFDERGLSEIVSFTSLTNHRSSAVMERLGMQRDGEFDHPAIAPGHRLRRHVLYRLGRDAYAATAR